MRLDEIADFIDAYIVKVFLVVAASAVCVVNRYDPKRPEKIKDMVLQRICAAGVEP